MLRDWRDVGELERLLELRTRAGAVTQVEQRLAQAHACERLAPGRANLPAEPRSIEQVRAGGLEIVGEELRLAEHGGGERLAAAGPRPAGLGAKAFGEARDTVVRVTRREDVFGHTQIGIEDTARELRRVPDLGELPTGMLFPAAVEVSEHALEVGELAGGRSEPIRLSGEPPRALPIAGVPRDHPAKQHEVAQVLVSFPLHNRKRSPCARNVARRKAGARLLRSQRGLAPRGRDLD